MVEGGTLLPNMHECTKGMRLFISKGDRICS